MTRRFVCLANSYKEGGRCVAGIEVDENNSPIFDNDRPRWIRPISQNNHGEIPNNVAQNLNILDIVEIESIDPHPQGYQSENITFELNSLNVVGHFDLHDLDELCDDLQTIFGNRGKAISQDVIDDLEHSLMLVSIENFEILSKTYPDKPNKSQLRLVFQYNGHGYDLPITDPSINNINSLNNCEHVFLTLSVGVEFNGWYYKLVAGIIH